MLTVPLGIVTVSVIGWYVVAMILFVRNWGDDTVLSEHEVFMLRLVNWLVFVAVLWAFISWTLLQMPQPKRKRRPSDSDWRTHVFLHVALSATLLSALVASFFLADSFLADIEVNDMPLITPLEPFQVLLFPLCITPLLLALAIYVGFGRERGNAMNTHIN